jgi:ribosomal protein S18 acetylase RimI-like enzyme
MQHVGGWPVRPGRAIDPGLLRAIEVHETRALALGGREVRDLGDAILLHDPSDPDPFWNRVAALRLPSDADAFDARLAELLVLFASLDRRPHLVVAPAHTEPPDLASRLAGHGFRDRGRGRLMVATAVAPAPGPDEAPSGVSLERWDGSDPTTIDRLANEIAELLVAGFEVDRELRPRVAADLRRAIPEPGVHLVVARDGTTPVAVAKRVTFGGLTYLSSIATSLEWRGRGLGSLVTRVAAADGLDEGGAIAYLGVEPGNHRAVVLYERLGFELVGDPIGHWLLADR